jgi:hypothetical protein
LRKEKRGRRRRGRPGRPAAGQVPDRALNGRLAGDPAGRAALGSIEGRDPADPQLGAAGIRFFAARSDAHSPGADRLRATIARDLMAG